MNLVGAVIGSEKDTLHALHHEVSLLLLSREKMSLSSLKSMLGAQECEARLVAAKQHNL